MKIKFRSETRDDEVFFQSDSFVITESRQKPSNPNTVTPLILSIWFNFCFDDPALHYAIRHCLWPWSATMLCAEPLSEPHPSINTSLTSAQVSEGRQGHLQQ